MHKRPASRPQKLQIRTEESRADSCCVLPDAAMAPLPVLCCEFCAAWAAWRAERRSDMAEGQRRAPFAC